MSHSKSYRSARRPSDIEADPVPLPEAVQQRIGDLQERLVTVAKELPIATLTTALVSGFILGKLVSRV